MSLVPTPSPEPAPSSRPALTNLREYVEETLYLDTDAPEDLRLLVEDSLPPYDEADIYDARVAGADLREAQAHERDEPTETYVPPHHAYADPVTGELQECMTIGASRNAPTESAWAAAPRNAYVLRHQTRARQYIRRVPRVDVLGVVDTLDARDIQCLRDMHRLTQVDVQQHRRLTMLRLMKDKGISRQAIHKRHTHALRNLLEALLAWHAQRPER